MIKLVQSQCKVSAKSVQSQCKTGAKSVQKHNEKIYRCIRLRAVSTLWGRMFGGVGTILYL